MMLQASRPPGNGSRERASHPQDKSQQLAQSRDPTKWHSSSGTLDEIDSAITLQ